MLRVMPHEVKLKVIKVKPAITLAKRGDNVVKFLIVHTHNLMIN